MAATRQALLTAVQVLVGDELPEPPNVLRRVLGQLKVDKHVL